MKKTIIFDGRKFAGEKEMRLKKKVADLKKKGVTPKLATLLFGENEASELYVSLKKKAGQRIGAVVEIHKLDQRLSLIKVLDLVRELNKDSSVHGIMVQLPLPKILGGQKRRILKAIAKEKDVDGLKEGSHFLPATVKAVREIMQEARAESPVAVIGAAGAVGEPLLKVLKKGGYEVKGFDKRSSRFNLKEIKNFKTVVSVTGTVGLIEPDLIREDAVVIDVGSPQGDVVFDEVSQVASFLTPVPGGVGPVTIVCLLENLVAAAYNSL